MDPPDIPTFTGDEETIADIVDRERINELMERPRTSLYHYLTALLNVTNMFPSKRDPPGQDRYNGNMAIMVDGYFNYHSDKLGIGRSIGDYNSYVVARYKELTKAFHSLRALGNPIKRILMSDRFRNELHRLWRGNFVLTGRDAFAVDLPIGSILSYQLAVPIPNPHRGPGKLPGRRWYRRLLLSAIMANYLFRCVFGVSRALAARANATGLRFSLRDFYRQYMRDARRQPTLARALLDPPPLTWYDRRPRVDEEHQRTFSIMYVNATTGTTRAHQDSDMFDRIRMTYGFLPGAIEIGMENQLALFVGTDREPQSAIFPGSTWLANTFDRRDRERGEITMPWYTRTREIPLLEYYSIVREALIGPNDGCDVFRVPAITVEGLLQPPGLSRLEMDRKLAVDIYGFDQVLFPGYETVFVHTKGREQGTARLMAAPVSTGISSRPASVSLRGLRFINNELCHQWLSDLLEFSGWRPRPIDRNDPDAEPATLDFHTVFLRWESDPNPRAVIVHPEHGPNGVKLAIMNRIAPGYTHLFEYHRPDIEVLDPDENTPAQIERDGRVEWVILERVGVLRV